MEYAIVVFTDTNEVALVSKSWYDGNQCCLWPNYKDSTRLNAAVRKHERPKDNWTSYPIRELRTEKDYLKAMSKAEEALDTSDLQTAESDNAESPIHRKRQRKPNSRYIADEDEDTDEDLPILSKRPRTSVSSPQIVHAAVLPAPPVVTARPREDTEETVSVPPSPSADIPAEVMSPSTPRNREPVTERRTPTISTPQNRLSQNDPASRSSYVSARDLQMLTALEELKVTMRSVLEVQKQILRHVQLGGVGSNTEDLPDDIQLPLTNMDAVEELERRLQDPVVERCLQRQLSLIGGTTPKDTTRRILKQLLTDSLALQFTWKGMQGKRAFQDLKLKKVIMKALRQNPDTRNVSRSDIEKASIDWFRYAKDRNGGRKQRMLKSRTITQTESADREE